MKIYFLDNKVPDATILGQSSEKLPYYPASRIKTSSPRFKWRTDGLQTMNEWISFDLASPKTIDMVQALGSNIQDTAWIYVELADDSGFTTGLVSYSLKGAELKTGKFFTSVQKRYLRLKIYDGICFVGTSGGSTSSYDSCIVNGKIYVCSKHRISIFDAETLEFLSYFGSYGTNDGQFNIPVSICSDGQYLFIADYANHRIQKFTLSGEFISKIGSLGSGDDQFYNPQCIRHYNGKLYVCDKNNSRLKVHSASDLSFIENHSLGDISAACWIDSENSYILITTSTAVYVYQLSDFSVVKSRTGFPGLRGVVQKDNYVYISEYGNHKIIRLNYSDLSDAGSYSPGTGSLPGQLNNPFHLNFWQERNLILISNYYFPYFVVGITPGLKFQSNPDGYLEIGKLNTAEKKTFVNHVVTQFSDRPDDKSLMIETDNLVVFSVRKETLQHVSFRLEVLRQTDKDMLKAFAEAYGRTRAFAVYIEDESAGNYFLPNMKFSSLPQFEEIAYNNYQTKIDLVEEK